MIRRLAVPLFGLGLTLAGAAGWAQTPNTRTIRGMRFPALSPDGSKVAFSYRGELWTAPATGGTAVKLAELPGVETRARWSPDGSTLAFCSDLHENLDIYTIPASGGKPTRVTFHSADDLLTDWTPDGKALVFYGSRETRVTQIYTITLADGRLRQLVQDEIGVYAPALSPDGKKLAYCRGTAGWARKNYRGSANADLWSLDLEKPEATPRRLTHTPVSEFWPAFSGDSRSLYFVSDAGGVGNFWKLPAGGGTPRAVTKQKDGWVHNPSFARDGRTCVYETDFSFWRVDLARSEAPRRLEFQAALDEKPRVSDRRIQRPDELEISPDGTLLALGYRGDIYVCAADGSNVRCLTQGVVARDFDFDWSPDSKSLVFTSERDANVDLYLTSIAGGAVRRLTNSPEPETDGAFSPDGRQIAYLRGANGREIRVMSADGAGDKSAVAGPFLTEPRWSPDGAWLTYTRRNLANVTSVCLTGTTAKTAGSKEINVSNWSGQSSNPVWGHEGRWLFFSGNRGGTSADLYKADLWGNETRKDVQVDGLSRRITPVAPQLPGTKGGLVVDRDGKSVLVSVLPSGTNPGPGAGTSFALYSVGLGGGAPTRILERGSPLVRLSPDGSTLYLLGFGGVQKVARSGGTPTSLTINGGVQVDLAEERRQTFDQGWRLLRDYFYDPKMHGVDWNAVRQRYRPIVDECVEHSEFTLLLTEMIGELNASHLGARRTRNPQPTEETAALGLSFDYQRPGPGLRIREVLREGPADLAAIRTGEYLVAINGRDVEPSETLAKILNGLRGKEVELLVNDRPGREGARSVKLTAQSATQAQDARYEHWVLSNRDWVTRASGGRLSYLHIKSMDQASLQRFERELALLGHPSEGIVVDVRNNPGGRIHDDLFALLTRKIHAYETPRDALKMSQPFGATPRPMVLLINQSSGSDAEIFANGFRFHRLGKVVGVPTAAAVIGTGDLQLLDGETTFRVPRTGWHTVDGVNLENTGVAPDLHVELLPQDVLAGRDSQLERATRELLKALKPRG